MKGEDIYDAVTNLSDGVVEEAKQQPLRRRRRRAWFGAIAAVLAVAMVAGYFLMPGSSPLSTNAYAISEAEYPETAQYPNENDYFSANGEFDSDAYSAAYDAWWEDMRAKPDASGYANGLVGYFTSSTAQFLSGAGSENVAFSPLNVYIALAMLAELTDGESRAQILSLLGSDSIEALRQQANDLWNASYVDDGATASILASSVWLNENVSFNQDTMDTLAQNYYASSYQGAMGSAEFNKALQDWLNEQTGGLLADQIGGIEMNVETVLALATTVYFRAMWSSEFNEAANTQELFHAPDGVVTVEFMHQSGIGNYYRGENFSAVYRALRNSGSMWFILPDEGVSVDEVLASDEYMQLMLNPWDWDEVSSPEINLSVPKFDVSSQIDLIDGLKSLGVTDVFDPSISDFTPMTTDVDEIYIKQALHGARVAIDEEGVTAAAYTVMIADAGAAMPDEEIDFTLDRPFIYAITTNDNLPLFTGVVNNPA